MNFVQQNPLARNLSNFCHNIFHFETKPVSNNFISAALSIICDDRFQSVYRVSEHYYRDFTGKSKNSLYYLFSGTQYAFPEEWNKTIVEKALATIPEKYKDHAIFLSIDDTIIEKYGSKFENCSDVYDHNESKFVNGYCMLSIVMTIPCEDKNGYSLNKIPLGFKIWKNKDCIAKNEEYKTKFDIIIEWLKEIINIIGNKRKIIILCDAWYTKGPIVEFYHKYENVELIGAINNNAKLYHLPQEKKPGTKGRTPLKGKEFTLDELNFESIPGEKLQFAHKEVKSRVFGLDTILDLSATKSQNGSIRLFVSTCKNFSDYIDIDVIKKSNQTSTNLLEFNIAYLSFAIYTIRWNIETFFYEIKKFWGLELFMVRGFEAIYRLVNFLSVIYASMALLPYYCEDFHSLRGLSPQGVRSRLGALLRELHFLDLMGKAAQLNKMPAEILNFIRDIAKSLKFAC